MWGRLLDYWNLNEWLVTTLEYPRRIQILRHANTLGYHNGDKQKVLGTMTRQFEGYVFIVTYGRSGSTLLQTLLQSINGYFIRGENANALLPLYQSVSRIATARVDHGYREIEAKGPWYGINQVEPERYAKKLLDVFIEEIIQPPEDARVIGFKEIRVHEAKSGEFERYLDFMATHFAPAKFIFNRRGWEDVAASGWWKNCEPELVKGIVEEADGLYADYVAKHPDRCFVAQYEDYVGKPDYWRAMFKFLGEVYDPDTVKSLCERRLKH